MKKTEAPVYKTPEDVAEEHINRGDLSLAEIIRQDRLALLAYLDHRGLTVGGGEWGDGVWEAVLELREKLEKP